MAKFYFDTVRPSEVPRICEVTLSDPHLAYRPPSLLFRSQAADRLLACRVNQTLIGWVEIYPLWGRDWGISTLFVSPAWRRQGLAGRLLVLADRRLSGHRVFATTSHPGVVKVLLALNYQPVSFWQMPKAVLAAQFFIRYYHPASWIKLFTSARNGLKFFVRP